MENNFKESNIINNLMLIIKRNKSQLKITNSKLPMDTNRIYKACIKLCKLWNTNQDAREFVIDLIDKFLPFNSARKVNEFKSEQLAHDALLRDVELVGIDELLSVLNKFSIFKEKSDKLEDIQKSRGDYQSFENRIDTLRTWLTNQPYKILHADFGYYSPGYKKYLCRESIKALQIFVQELVKLNEQAIINIISSKKSKAYTKAINKKNKSLEANIDNADDIYAKFSRLK